MVRRGCRPRSRQEERSTGASASPDRGARPDWSAQPAGAPGRRLRQRDVRELLRDPRMRVAGTPPLCLAGRGEDRLGFSFIEGWYNPARLHSALGYRSPMAYEHAIEVQPMEA